MKTSTNPTMDLRDDLRIGFNPGNGDTKRTIASSGRRRGGREPMGTDPKRLLLDAERLIEGCRSHLSEVLRAWSHMDASDRREHARILADLLTRHALRAGRRLRRAAKVLGEEQSTR